jgi:hypothetical protein
MALSALRFSPGLFLEGCFKILTFCVCMMRLRISQFLLFVDNFN